MAGIALIGTGRIGRIHARNVALQRDLQLLHVIDIDVEAATEVASEYCADVSDIDTALSDPNVDGVIIASATPTHAAFVSAACDAGKSIFCEKPIDLDLETSRDCAGRISRSGTTFLLGFNRRFDPHFRRLKERLDAGEIGQIETIHITSHDPAPPPISYIQSSGGIFKDMTIHDFDMARWLLNEELIEVHACGGVFVDAAIAEVGDIDTAKVILKSESGRLCVISNCRRAAYGYDQRVEVFGSEGTIRLNNVPESQVTTWSASGCASENPQHFFLQRYADAYRNEIEHFASIIDGTADSQVTVNDGLAAISLAEAAGQSLKDGAPVQISKEVPAS